MNTESQLATRNADLQIIDGNTEILPPSAIESMQRAEIDVQISTAHRFPRSMKKFKERAIEMATLDEETAASCIYSRPVGGGKFAEGLSVRTAEIVGACYGNLRVAATIVEQTERYVKARGMAHDLESNFASACEVIESTVKRDGTPYDERMRIVIAKACLAKARRDATFQVVPKALCKPVETAARAVAVGDASTISKKREQLMMWIGKLGIDAARVFGSLGVAGVDDIGIEHLTTLTGVKTAIKDGEVTVDEAFPPIIKEGTIGAEKKSPLAKKPVTSPEPKPQAETPPPADPPTEKQAPSGAPDPEPLRKKLFALGVQNNIGRSLLADRLIELKYLEEGRKITDLDANELDALIEAWPEILDKITTPGGEQ